MKDTASNRRQKILQKLQKDGTVNSAELAKEFHVTMETIRKDLHALAQEKLIIKDFGGARISHITMEKPMTSQRVICAHSIFYPVTNPIPITYIK